MWHFRTDRSCLVEDTRSLSQAERARAPVRITAPITRGPTVNQLEPKSVRRPLAILARLRQEEQGAATAEYAVATMAAVGFAGLLVVILRSDAVRAMLTDLVQRALTFAG
jgi:threonine/homoserine/homoserine lactone efflux protein